MSLSYEGQLQTGQQTLDTDIRDLHVVSDASGTFVYVATGILGGISVYDLDATAPSNPVDTAYFSALSTAPLHSQLDVLPAATGSLLIAGLAADGSLIHYGIQGDAGLGPAGASGFEQVATALSAWACGIAPDGAYRIYAADPETGLLASYEHDGDRFMRMAEDPGAPSGDTAYLATAGQTLLALSADPVAVLTSYRQTAHGLQQADRLDGNSGLGISVPTAVESLRAFETDWLLVAAAGSNTISVVRVGADGELTPADHVMDTLETRFGAVQSLSVVEVEGHVLIFAAGGDDGVSVFSLLPDGRLVHRQSLAHAAGLGLEDVTALAAVRLEEAVQLVAGSEAHSGLTRLSWDISTLGQILQPDTEDQTLLQGENGDDLLYAPGSRVTTLRGGAGDDILVSGAQTSLLDGGAGADIFVLELSDTAIRIVGFTPGEDQLDLSALPLLRGPGQLLVTPMATGMRLGYRGMQVSVESASGQPLTLADLWPEGRFDTPDRLILHQPRPISGVVEGSAGNDTLTGTATDDSLNGLAGDDSMRGLQGNDTLWGADGKDTLVGGNGADLLNGGLGHDTLRGGTGKDTLIGDAGKDDISGDAGADKVHAGAGADQVNGGRGNDRLWGQKGADHRSGDEGHDRLEGGTGRDTLDGGSGNDRLKGGAGADLFVFRPDHGRDHIADFTPDLDLIRLDGTGLRFANLVLTASENGTAISSAEGEIQLGGIFPDQLDADDFLFV